MSDAARVPTFTPVDDFDTASGWIRYLEPDRGEIIYWFRPAITPAGSAPLDVREGWVGVPLPVRRPRPAEGPEPYVGRDVLRREVLRQIPDGVSVAAGDAIASLEHFGRPEAAAWWRSMIERRPATSAFVFRRAEGELMPPRLAFMLHPELEDSASWLDR